MAELLENMSPLEFWTWSEEVAVVEGAVIHFESARGRQMYI